MRRTKKLFVSVISAAMLFSIAGCNKDKNKNSNNNSTNNQTQIENNGSTNNGTTNTGTNTSTNTGNNQTNNNTNNGTGENQSGNNGSNNSSNEGNNNNNQTNNEDVPEGKEVSPIVTNEDIAPVDNPENSTPYVMPELIPHEPIVSSIDATGGKLGEAEGDISISFPAGALKETKQITATYIDESSFINDNPLMNFMGAVEFGPSGTTFDEDVEVTMKLSRRTNSYSPELSVFCYDETNKIWDYVTDASYEDGNATFSVRHFSKYQCLEITPAMLNKFNDLVYEAKASGYNDAWVMSNYEDYLVNEERVMDYYTQYEGLWYEPVGLYIHGDYQLNGVKGDPNVLNKQVGESNKVGNKYGLCKVGGQFVSTKEYEKAKENNTTEDLIDVSVTLDYKMIKPDINIQCTSPILEKGQTTTPQVQTHYANPNNKTFPDFTLPNYPLTLPYQLKHFSTSVDELVTDDNGMGTFDITANEEGVEFIKVMFYVEGYFGNYAANFLKVKCGGDFTISGHIEQKISGTFTFSETIEQELFPDFALTNAGSFSFTIGYDFKGMLDLNDDDTCSGMIYFTNMEVECTGTDAVYEAWDPDGGYGRLKCTYYDEDFISVAFGSYSFTGTLDEVNSCNIVTQQTSVLGLSCYWENINEYISGGGEHLELDLPTFGIFILQNKANLLLEFDLEEGVDYANSSSLKDTWADHTNLELLFSLLPQMAGGETKDMFSWFKINITSESTTQEIEVTDNRDEAQD